MAVRSEDQLQWEDVSLGLPENIWHRVAAYLHTHELLGRLVVLSAGHAALLTDEGCWGTLALPTGPTRLGHLLWLMLLEERELWVPLLHQVHTLDLDMDASTTRTVSFFRDLLLHGLSIDRALRSIRVLRIPIRPAMEPGTEAPAQRFTKSDLALVNPVPRNSANDRRLFLLDPQELGKLRLNMVHFRYVRICPSTQASDASVDLVAQHEMPQGEAADAAYGQDAAEALMLAELGTLEALPQFSFGACNSTDDTFAGWLGMLLPRYRVLLSSWE